MNLEDEKIMEDMMFCTKCQHEIKECICSDIDERLQNSGLVYRICKVCGKHYDRCKCESPLWTTNLPVEFNNKELTKSEKYDLLINLTKLDKKNCSDIRCPIYDICKENDFCYILKMIIKKIDKLGMKNEKEIKTFLGR